MHDPERLQTAAALPPRCRGRVLRILLACLLMLPPAIGMAGETAATTPDTTVAAVERMVDAGQFHAAEARIAAALQDSATSEAARTALRFQRDRMHRILLDFDLGAGQVKAKVRKEAPGLTDA